jgi:hypothetical protein
MDFVTLVVGTVVVVVVVGIVVVVVEVADSKEDPDFGMDLA